MLKPTQMCLAHSMLSIADIAVSPEAVAELVPWELFEPVRVKYERARFERSKRQTPSVCANCSTSLAKSSPNARTKNPG